MASMSNQRASSLVSSSSSSSSTPQWKYDVFLSFRGKDTRNNFTDHLYAALDKKGIVVFKDDEELERGKAIAPELLKAIAESRFSIVIFSRKYASSSWCLDELVKIVECSKEGQVVLPVFYDVDPSEVRKQTGSFQEDFAKHEQVFRENIKKVEEWRTAMTKVASLFGWHIQNRPEAKLIEGIVKEILCKSHTSPRVANGLVGIKSRVKELNLFLGEGLNDVRFIGICGMGGIGKTTIARVVYERSHQFKSSCFLVNVREVSKKQGLVPLQNQLLSEVLEGPNINIFNVYKGVDMIRRRLRYKKVLIILDDVDNLEQLNMLAGDHGWFGPGSRIIITTRDEHLLRTHGVDEIYKVEELDDDESLMLFSRKAFKLYHPARDYEELSKRVVNYANGLPLALEVLGSFLYGRSIEVWKSTLERLDKHPNEKILEILKVSFDGLEEVEKTIFLDIACFFIGSDKDQATRILDACGFCTNSGIEVLIDKFLIKMVENKLWMHDLVQVMGQEIVRRECIKEPGKRSRLWDDEDVNHVLTKNTGTEVVETMFIYLPKHPKAQLNVDSFSKMRNLRLLSIRNVDVYQSPKCLSNELRLLEWHGCPLKCLPNFELDKLVELNMCYSGIKLLWKEKEALKNLKFITLSHSKNLTKTPDFTGIPNLEKLILESCTRLCEVHPSVLLLRKLILLNLGDCKNLRSLPSNIQMESLEIFILSGCSKLKKFPKIIGEMERLSELYLDGTAVEELPSSIEHLRGLVLLSLKDCKNLVRLPKNINGLKSLKTVNLSGCIKLVNVPKNLGRLECFEELDIRGTALRQQPFASFPLKHVQFLLTYPAQFLFLLMRRNRRETTLMLSSLLGLCSLTKLELSNCNLSEGAIPNDFDRLSSLRELNLSSNIFVSLPVNISRLSQLYELNLEDCKMLQSLPELSSNLEFLWASGCTSLKMLPDPLTHCNTCGTHFYCYGCDKLVENQDYNSLPTRMLNRYLQGANLRGILDIVIPGNKIPKWFYYQTEAIIQSLPIGYALCSTFVVHRQPVNRFGYFGVHRLMCSIEADGINSPKLPTVWVEENLGQADHLWLLYLSHKKVSRWIRDVDKASCISFSIIPYGPGLEVKNVVVRPVYEQDVVELNQTMNQYNDEAGPSGTNYSEDDSEDEFEEVYEQDVVELNQTMNQYNDEAGPSGTNYYEDDSEDEFEEVYEQDVVELNQTMNQYNDEAGPSGTNYSEDEFEVEMYLNWVKCLYKQHVVKLNQTMNQYNDEAGPSRTNRSEDDSEDEFEDEMHPIRVKCFKHLQP